MEPLPLTTKLNGMTAEGEGERVNLELLGPVLRAGL